MENNAPEQVRPLRSAVAILIAVLAMSIGAVAPAFAEETPAPTAKRVGVISMVGDVLFQRQLGVTAFGNKQAEYDATDLGLDAVWEGKIRDAAAPLGPFEFVDITIDKAALIATYPRKGGLINNWRYLRFKKTAPIFLQIAAENRLDYIIVLGGDAYSVVEGVMSIEGVGIFTSKRLGGTETINYLISQLAYIDGATGKPIETEYLTVGSRWSKGYGGFPVVEAPAELNAKPYAEYAPEEKAALRDRLSSVADAGWTRSLAKLFGVELPAAGQSPDEPSAPEQSSAEIMPAGAPSPEGPPAESASPAAPIPAAAADQQR